MGFYKSRDSHSIITSLNRSEAPKLLPNRYMLQPMVIIFRSRNFISQLFDIKIQQLSQLGLIDYYIRKDDEEYNLQKFKSFEQPFKVLTLEELHAGFVVSTSPLILSLVVFCLEWIVTLFNYLIFYATFKAYFDMRSIEQNHEIALSKINLQIILKKRAENEKRHELESAEVVQ